MVKDALSWNQVEKSFCIIRLFYPCIVAQASLAEADVRPCVFPRSDSGRIESDSPYARNTMFRHQAGEKKVAKNLYICVF